MIKYSKVKNCILVRGHESFAFVVHRFLGQVEIWQYQDWKDQPEGCWKCSIETAEPIFKLYQEQGYRIAF